MTPARAVALLLVLAAGAGASGYNFYGEQIAFAERGNRYLIIRQLWEPKLRTTFEFCERAPGTPGPRIHRENLEDTTTVVRGAKDRVIAQGELEDAPLDMWVLDETPSAILFENWGWRGHGHTLARLDGNGKLRWALELSDLELGDTDIAYTSAGTLWHAGWWVDEARDRVVLVAVGGVLNLVDLETGKLTSGDPSVALESMRSPSPMVRWRAFTLCPETLAPEGWKAQARAALADERLPASTRLAAALALHRAGGKQPDPPLFLAALRERSRRDEIATHVAYAGPRVLGPLAAPLVEDYARRFPIRHPRLFAYRVLACGDAGIPLLVRLATTGTPEDVRWGAAQALGRLKSAASRAAFVRLVRGGGIFPRFDDPALTAALAESLRTPGHYDAAIAALLAKDPKPEYAEPLAVALSRHEKGSPEHEAIAAALGACK